MPTYDYPFDVTTSGSVTVGGETFSKSGELLLPPPDIPEPRATDGGDTILHVGQNATGDGSGSDSSNLLAVADIIGDAIDEIPTVDPRDYTVINLYGRLSRFRNEGPDPFNSAYIGVKHGTSDRRTIWKSDTTNPAELMGGIKLGSGVSGDGSWTDNGDSASTSSGNPTYTSIQSGSVQFTTVQQGYILTEDAGGNIVVCDLVDSLANCQSTANSAYVEMNYSGSNDRVTIHRAASGSPKDNTYFGNANAPGIRILPQYAEYVDFFGLTLYQDAIRFEDSNYQRWYGVSILYPGARKGVTHIGYHTNEDSGLLVTNQSTWSDGAGKTIGEAGILTGIEFFGCLIQNASDGWYPTQSSGGHIADWKIEHCLANKIGIDEQGYNLGNTDSHSYAHMGANGWRLHNCAARDVGWTTCMQYLTTSNILTPSTEITDASISNGEFDSDLSGWTDSSTGTGSISQEGGRMRLSSASTGNIGIAEQEVSIGASFQSDSHYLVFDLFCLNRNNRSSFRTKIGSTQGNNDIADLASSPAGYNKDGESRQRLALKFDPAANSSVWVRFEADTVLGCTWEIDNVRIVTDPSSEDGYTTDSGLTPLQNTGGNNRFYCAQGKNIEVSYCLFSDLKTHVDNPSLQSDAETLSLGADTDVYGHDQQIRNIRIHDNVIKHPGLGGGDIGQCLRIKWSPEEGSSRYEVQVYRNAVDTPGIGMFQLGSTGEDDSGNTPRGIWSFHHNLIHDPVNRQVKLSNVDTPEAHEHYLDFNNYSFVTTDVSAPWQTGSSTLYETITAWRAAAPTGDVYDDNSTHGESLGLPEMVDPGRFEHSQTASTPSLSVAGIVNAGVARSEHSHTAETPRLFQGSLVPGGSHFILTGAPTFSVGAIEDAEERYSLGSKNVSVKARRGLGRRYVSEDNL